MIRRTALAQAMMMAFALTLTGCSSDPYDPQTWIKKLDESDPRDVRQAVTELQRLKDPVAIGPLAKTWEKQNRPATVLRVIVELAARDDNGGPHWENALEPLRTAVSDLDEGDPRSIENAIIGADAIGMAKDKDSIDTLIKAANKTMPLQSKGQRARLAAVRAMGKFGSEPTTVDALIKVLAADTKDQPVELFAAAAEALADARSPKAVGPLLETFFKIPHPGVAKRCRTALIAIGKPVIAEAQKIFDGEHKDINKLAREKKFNVDCERGMGPDTSCQAPSNLQYKSSQLLGDLQAKSAVKSLMEALEKPSVPAFFSPDGAPGPSQHAAILDALKRIGDSSAARAALGYATNTNTDDLLRPLAIDTYSYLTNDVSGLSALAKFIKDEEGEEQLRLAAGVTYGRLTRSTSDYGPLTYMIERYRKEADKNEGKRKQAEKEYQSADKAYKDALKKAEADKNNRKLQKAADNAKAKMEKAYEESQSASGQVAGYRRFQRTFEQNLARAHIGVTCKDDPKCYITVLDKKADDLGKDLSKYITDWKDWSEDEKSALKLAAVERSLIELSKMGEGARPVFDKILEKVESTDRILRQGCLLVMIQTAKLPCQKCVSRLDEIIAKQGEETTLDQLTDETRAARNYFQWAGT